MATISSNPPAEAKSAAGRTVPAGKPAVGVLPDVRALSFDATLASATSSIAFRETIHLAIDSFRASKVRFLLTMLGMVIGSASIILVVAVGLTGRKYALDLISGIGPNMIEMQYVGGTVAGPENTSTPDSMTRADMAAVLNQVPGIVTGSRSAAGFQRTRCCWGFRRNIRRCAT